ncbi:MAG TPA: hypothetical protein VNS09_20395 [Solirubrobacter sp.]|nr:hypothetical protein [Solirubrobacter sp.]
MPLAAFEWVWWIIGGIALVWGAGMMLMWFGAITIGPLYWAFAKLRRLRNVMKWADGMADEEGYRLYSTYPVKEYRAWGDPIYLVSTMSYRGKRYYVCVKRGGSLAPKGTPKPPPTFCDREGDALPPKVRKRLEDWDPPEEWWRELRARIKEVGRATEEVAD